MGKDYYMPLFFNHRKKLAEMYKKWIKENDVKDSPENVISFLVINCLIDSEKAISLIKNAEQ